MLKKEKNKKDEILNEEIVLTADKVEEDEIDIGKIFGMFLEKIHYIIMFFMLGALIFNAYAYFMIHPTYESTAKLYAVSASDDAVVSFADLNIGQALTKDYEELIYSYPVMDEVIDTLDLDMTSDQLASMITIENPEDTRVLKITTTSTDPKLSKKITNALTDSLRSYLPKVMSTTKPNIVQRGRLEPKKVGPSYLKYLMIGGVLFAGIYCIILVILFLMDDTIKTVEDVENEFGFPPLTAIPESEMFASEDVEVKKRRFLGRGSK